MKDFNRYKGPLPHLFARVRGHMQWLPTALLVVGGVGMSTAARADNPGYDRPGYGFTPMVLAAGEVTAEQGLPDWSRNHSDGVSSSLATTDSLLRVGVGGPFEVQLGGSRFDTLRETGAGRRNTSDGHGDSNLAVKFALPGSNKAFSWGLLASVEFTDGSRAFRNNRRHYLLGAQFNTQVGARNSLGAYLEDVRVGGRNSTTVAFSDNYSASKTLTLYVETALLHTPDQGSGTLAGGGVAWMVTPRVQIDAGFDHRTSGSAPEWQTNLGVSVYFGR